jgi:hypothetical protein
LAPLELALMVRYILCAGPRHSIWELSASRLRLTIAHLMTIVLYVGVGFAALRNADEFWAVAAYTLAVVGAFARSGRARTPRSSFAVFGWTHLLFLHLPDLSVSGVRLGQVPNFALGRTMQPEINIVAIDVNESVA